MLRSCIFVLTLLGSVTSQSQSPPPHAVRLALVNVPEDVLRPLLPAFEQQHGRGASIVYTGNDPFAAGRNGNADLVIAHFGHDGVESFVTEGHGLWPKVVFANQMALIGPASDPAGVRGVRTLTEAYRRIATTKSLYLSNASAGARYVEAIALAGTDIQLQPIAANLENQAAVRAAADRGAYVLWGVPPFLRWKRQLPIEQTTDLEPLVVDDPTLQRVMVSITVNPKTVKGVNADAARAFQDFLLSPAIQARVAAFRYPDFDKQVWWPAGRHNSARD
ncbi:MAG TPA: substrate-binding domain-containing protein [Vicinamibacterales bacterium]|nr:substrate-binding domain-containing protein [Vicinamibacterales bacterium]